MNMKSIFLASLLLLPAVSPLAALEPAPATSPAGTELAWADCVKEALANNPALKAKKLAIDQYKYLYFVGYNSYLPKISMSHSVSRSGGENTDPSNRWGLSLSASEPVFNLAAMSSIRAARISYDKTYSDYKVQSASLRQTLYSAFMTLVAAQEQVRVDNRTLAIREENAKLIRLKYDSGQESRGNMLYASAIFALSRVNAAKSGRALQIARRELLRNMGISEYRPITALGTLTAPEFGFNAETLQTILDNLPQMVSQKKSVESQKERLLTARYDLFPVISASQSMSWSGPEQFDVDRSWSLGLSMSLPLLSGGLTYYPNSTKAAKLALKGAEESLKDLRLSLGNSILNGYENFLNARDTADANLSVVAANEERYKESQIKYMAGKISFTDLTNVEQSMVDAQQNQLQYLRNANNSKFALENLLGVGLED
jgi:outer membrane protein TolC